MSSETTAASAGQGVGQGEGVLVEEAWGAEDDDETDLAHESDPLRLRRAVANELPPGWMLVQHTSGRVCYQHLESRVMVQTRPYVIGLDEEFDAHVPPPVLASALQQLPNAGGSCRDGSCRDGSFRDGTFRDGSIQNVSGGKGRQEPQQASCGDGAVAVEPAEGGHHRPEHSLAQVGYEEVGGLRLPSLQSSGAQSSGAQSSGLQSSGAQSSGAQSSGLQSSDLQSSGLRSSDLQSSGLQSSGLQSSGLQSSGPARVHHEGCGRMDVDVSMKTPVMILNELAPKLFKCFPQIHTTTRADPIHPYVTEVCATPLSLSRFVSSTREGPVNPYVTEVPTTHSHSQNRKKNTLTATVPATFPATFPAIFFRHVSRHFRPIGQTRFGYTSCLSHTPCMSHAILSTPLCVTPHAFRC